VKVGLYFDLRNPVSWRQDPARLHAFTLEAIEEAEHLGVDSIWLSEHHLVSNDFVAAPLTFLAAAAARTSRVRLGTDVNRARMAGWINTWVSDDPEADWPTVRRRMAHQFDTYASSGVEGTGQPAPPPVDPERVRVGGTDQLLGYLWCDEPATVAKKITNYTADAPVETVLIFASLAGMAEPMVIRHIQTIATRLAPLLAG
jgi:Luciferase-like monooxygenase